ncbi:glycerol-3-phosphate transporter, partial [Escherichia coli]|nr:glycerol-3-phosphate transporter [Escherichia coli]
WAFNDDWRTAFYVPAFFATLVAVFIWMTVRDTPQSCGLPPIEEYKDDYPDDYDKSHEQEMTAKEIFFKYVFNNKLLWSIAIANAFVYLIRYGV